MCHSPIEQISPREPFLERNRVIVFSTEHNEQSEVDQPHDHFAVGHPLAPSRNETARNPDSLGALVFSLLERLEGGAVDKVHVVSKLKIRANEHSGEIETMN